MEDIVFKSDDLVVMSLINYFITEKNYNPMIIHGLNDEIWLENLNEDYKIVRIVSHHIHNKEQLDFDKFKLSRIVKQVKKKTLSFKVKVLIFCRMASFKCPSPISISLLLGIVLCISAKTSKRNI